MAVANTSEGGIVVVIYDTNNNIVDIPTDMLSGTFEDVVNGGNSQGTLIVPRRFTDAPNPFPSNAGGTNFAAPIGAISTTIKLGFEYRVQLYFQDSVQPWWDGRIVGYDPEDFDTQDREQITFTCEGWQTRLGFGILTESVNPGVQPSGVNNGTINADTYLTHLVSTYMDSSTFGSAFIASIPISLNQITFDGAQLTKAIDDIVNQCQDSTGHTYEWWVRGVRGGKPALVIQQNQNPNTVTTGYTAPGVSGPTSFVYEQSKSSIKAFKITNSSQEIYNNIAAYGGKDPTTSQQIYSAFKDSTSISLYGLRQKKVTNSVLISQTSLNNYATVYLLLNGYPQPQATYKKIGPTDVMRAGKWVQIQSVATGKDNQSIFQMRALKVQIAFTSADYVEMTVTAAAPRPYIDQAYYAAVATAQNAIALNAAAFIQSAAQLYYLIKGFNWVSNTVATTPDFTQPYGLFSAGQANRGTASTSVSGNQGNDANGNPVYQVPLVDSVTGANGDGYYEVVFCSNPAATFGTAISQPDFVVIKGKVAASGTVLKGYSFTVSGGVIIGSIDQRVIGSTKAAATVQQNYAAPTASGASSARVVYTGGISVGILVTAPLTNVPQDGLVGKVVWCVRPYTSANNGAWATWAETTLSGVPIPPVSQTVSLTYGGLTLGASYDFGLAYVTTAGVASPNIGLILGNVTTPSVSLPGNYISNLAASTTPTFTGSATITPRPSLGGVTTTMNLSFTISNQPTDGSLADIVILAFRTGDSGNNIPLLAVGATGAGSASPPASAAYSIDVALSNASIGSAGTVNFYAAFQSISGGVSGQGYIGQGFLQFVALPAPYLLAGSSPTPTISSGGTPAYSPALTGLSCTATFTNLTFNNQPTDGSLSHVALFFKASTDSQWTPAGSLPAQGVGTVNPSASGSYTFSIGNLTNGVSYSFAFAYENNQGGLSSFITTASYAANPVSIATGYSLAGSTAAPALTAVSVAASQSANGVSADVTVSFNTTNQPTDGSLSRISYWVRASNVSGGAWNFYASIAAYGVGTMPPSASPATGIYSGSSAFVYADLVGGRAYDFGVSYENAQGGDTGVTTTTALMNFTPTVIAVGGAQAAAMPPAILASGPHFGTPAPTFNTANQINSGTATVGQPFTFTINDFAAGSPPNWYAGINVYWRASFTTTVHFAGVISPTTAVSLSDSIELAAGGTYDIGLAYIDFTNQISTIVFPSGLFSVVTAQINPPMTIAGTGTGNLLVDGQLSTINTTPAPNNDPLWYSSGLDGSTFRIQLPQQELLSATYGMFRFDVSGSSANKWSNSQPVYLQAGVSYVVSARIKIASNSTGSSSGLRIVGPITGSVSISNPGYNPSNVIATAGVTGSSTGANTTSSVFSPSTSGWYVGQVSNLGYTKNSSNQQMVVCEMQIMQGTAFTGFEPGGVVQTDTTTQNAGTQALLTHAPVVQLDTTGSQVNLTADSDIRAGTGPTAYWSTPPSGFGTTTNFGGKMAFFRSVPSGGDSQVNWYLQNTPAFTSVIAGGTYTLSALFDTSGITAGSCALIVLSGSSEIGPGRITAPAGLSYVNNNARLSSTFSVPSGTSKIQLVFQSNVTTGNSTVYVGQIQLEQNALATGYKANHHVHGTVGYFHTMMSPGLQSAFDSFGNLTSSSKLGNNTQSTLPFTTNFVMHTQFNNSSIQYWIDSGSDGAAVSLYYPYSGTSIVLPSTGTTSSPLTITTDSNGNAITASTVYYLLAYYTPSGWVVKVYPAPPTPAQKQVPINDGYVPFFSTGSVALTTSNSSSYSSPISRAGCPAIGTEIQTPSGLVLVENLHKGSFIRAPGGSWVRVNAHGISDAPLFEIITDTETFRVDGSHLFDITGNNVWKNVQELKKGDTLMAFDLRSPKIKIRSVRSIGIGRYAHIECEGFRYVLGRTISHNVKNIQQPQ